ncbi:GRB2-associated-binding protein 1-like [Syngnathoides biaculeatus]|uniref:GRB2-associated-binding protein 1-like n=1 Tax=Syngnathoides biaculeatus TaxID=300417 RepID=UPI002ADDEC9C|nr:GRB2-associated-binding protein 1-like [Syngnathoides biaculeatus]
MDPAPWISGAAEVVCEGWLQKSPPEKKLRRYTWKRRWFVLRSGRLSGEPNALQYYKNPHSRRPIRTINLGLCEQVDAGLSFAKKELGKSFVFALKTAERTWYLVAESEDDMNRWVASVCLLCGFKPGEEVPKSPPLATVAASAPPVRSPPLEAESGHAQESDVRLRRRQTCFRPPESSLTSQENESDNRLPPSSSCSPSTLGTRLPPSSFNSRTSVWVAGPLTGTLSRSLDFSVTPDLLRGGGKPQCHPSPHPRKHSLDFHLRPVAIPLFDAAPHFTPVTQPVHSSPTPRMTPINQAELCPSTPTPPPRPPKPVVVAAQGESPPGGYLRGDSLSGQQSLSAARSPSDRVSMFDFSDRFNSYFFKKGMIPLADGDSDENYVPMSAAATGRCSRHGLPSEVRDHRQETNYVPMTPVPAHLPASADPASFGSQVPLPDDTDFCNAPLTPTAALPLRMSVAGEGDPGAVPPPIHRDLKPPHSVPPPVHSPVSWTFTRGRHSARPTFSHSSSPASDSDNVGDSYVAMTTSSLSFDAGQRSLKLMRHRTSEGGPGSSSEQRARSVSQVEYLDLDLHTGPSTLRQKRCPDDIGGTPAKAMEECDSVQRVDYVVVVVDPKRTKAPRNTRETWHDGRMSTEKCKEHS